MHRLTISITDEQATLLEEKTGDNGEYESKSEAVRDFIQRGEQTDDQIGELKRTVERLENEKQALVDNRQQTRALQRYEEQQSLVDNSTLTERLRWFLTGHV